MCSLIFQHPIVILSLWKAVANYRYSSQKVYESLDPESKRPILRTA